MIKSRKPIIKTYKTAGYNVKFELKFKDRLTLINSDSGIGKTLLFKLLERDSVVSAPDIICLNLHNITDNGVENVLSTAKNKVIFIDNADVILNLGQRIDISLDDSNQYVIFTHSTEGYKPTKNSFTELVIENNVGKLKYVLG